MALEPHRASAIEYIGLTMILSMVTLGVLAAIAPETALRAILRVVLHPAGA